MYGALKKKDYCVIVNVMLEFIAQFASVKLVKSAQLAGDNLIQEYGTL